MKKSKCKSIDEVLESVRTILTEAKNDIKREPTRETILGMIADHLACVSNDAKWGHYDSAHSHEIKAKALINLLQMHDCEATGGFDEGQPYSNGNLQKQYEWLKDKYANHS